MKVFLLLEAEQPPMLVDVPKPKAGSGQVVNKVGGAGLCHTDLALIRRKKALHALALGIERIGLVSLRFPMAVAFVVIALAIAAGFGVARIEVEPAGERSDDKFPHFSLRGPSQRSAETSLRTSAQGLFGRCGLQFTFDGARR